MRLLTCVLITTMLLAGCTSTSIIGIGQSASGANGGSDKPAVPATAEECITRNGDWMQASQGIVVNFGPFRCLNYKSTDGGKSCQSDAECQGGCGPTYDKKEKLTGGVCYSRVSDHCLQKHYEHGVVSSCVY